MNNRKNNILVVDDSRAVRQLLKMVLLMRGNCDVVKVGDGEEAYEWLKTNTCDLLITDINMPGMNGLSLIGHVRNELNLQIPIVIVTTMGHEEERDAGLGLGADTYLTKPINGNHLIETVSGLIG